MTVLVVLLLLRRYLQDLARELGWDPLSWNAIHSWKSSADGTAYDKKLEVKISTALGELKL